MLTIDLDASGWQQAIDFYKELLAKLGAPSWHGLNLDAINDSIFGGQINEVEPPFRVILHNTASASENLKQVFRAFEELVDAGRRETRRKVFFEYA